MRFVKSVQPLLAVAVLTQVLATSGSLAAQVPRPSMLSASPVPQQVGPSPLGGSVPAPAQPGTLKLTLKEALDRALERNLAIVLGQQGVAASRGARLQSLSGVLPELSGSFSERRQTTNLETFGLRIPGYPALIGPFNVFDARVSLSQSLFDFGAIERAVAGSRNLEAADHSLRDTRDLVVVAAADLYFQTIAAHSRVIAVQAQVETAEALSRQATDLRESGLVAGIDVLRAQVQADAERQRLILARIEEQRQRLAFARAIGLPPGQAFELVDEMQYRPLEPVALDAAVKQAYDTREDLKAAEKRLEALQAEHKASIGDRLPSVHLAADYGSTGLTAGSALPTYMMAGVVRMPLFNVAAQRAHAVQTQAAVERQAALVSDLRAQVAYDVQLALADLAAADERVKVSKEATDLAAQQLQQARDRFAAGVGDNIAIVQAQQAAAAASDSDIASVFAHNAAKAALARAVGNAEESAGHLFGFCR